MRALTGPGGADLTVTVSVDANSQCALPQVLKKVQLKTFAADGTVASTRNVSDVPAPGGVATLGLGQVPRDRRVEVNVLLQTGTPERTFVLDGVTKTLLRPDLVVYEIKPKSALAGRPFTVTAVIAEKNGDIGATADVTLSATPGAVVHLDVPAGGTAEATFPALTFDAPVPMPMMADVRAAAPAETDTTNNTATASVDLTKNELSSPSTILFPSLLGYGAQFNGHLYAPITQPYIPPGEYVDVQQKIEDLQPQLVRIFYNDRWDENAEGTHPEWRDNYASFVSVVKLAQETGATIDISYQNLGNIVRPLTDPLRRTPEEAMAKYADALEDLVKNHGLTNVRWADVGNEPNSGAVTLDQIYALYRALHRELVARGLSDQIQLMGPGLVENAKSSGRTHYDWMKAIADNLGDILSGYAEHVYWIYDDPGRLEYRLRDTFNLMNTVIPEAERKPLYMMEFSARGYQTCGTKPSLSFRYYRDADCTEIWRTNIGAFQQFWFVVDSAQLGVAGASKWDAYWAVYDLNSVNQQVYWMTGPPNEGYPLMPTYHAMSLIFHTTAPGWKILRVDPWDDNDWKVATYGIEGHSSLDQTEQELVAYAGPADELTVLGLDTNGRSLNGASTAPPSSYSIGGLPPNTTFTLALWNASGDGTNSIAGPVTTNTNGVARFEVPLQAAFALTTVSVS